MLFKHFCQIEVISRYIEVLYVFLNNNYSYGKAIEKN